jgi:hypothetical protein
LEPGRAVKDCSIDNNYLIDKLGYHFTLLIDKIRLSEDEKKQLTDAEIDIIEIDIFKSDKLSKLYDLVDGGAYLFTPDQYILGRWRNFRLSTVLDLINSYMTGNLFEQDSLIKTEQEIIDEKIAETLRNVHYLNVIN